MHKETVRIPSICSVKEIAPPLESELRRSNVHEMNVADSEGVCLSLSMLVPSQLLTVP